MISREISWGRAFGYAIRYVAYFILWGIIGGLIGGAGWWMIYSSYEYVGPYSMPTIDVGTAITGLILIIIGMIITTLGTMATYFKLMSRLIRESTYRPSPPPSPP